MLPPDDAELDENVLNKLPPSAAGVVDGGITFPNMLFPNPVAGNVGNAPAVAVDGLKMEVSAARGLGSLVPKTLGGSTANRDGTGFVGGVLARGETLGTTIVGEGTLKILSSDMVSLRCALKDKLSTLSSSIG